MPGLGRLDDGAFLRGFQEIDRIIQRNHPIFALVWLGSILSLIATAFVGFSQLEGWPLGLLVSATALYLFGVQLPTFRGNLPLNNQLQILELTALSEAKLANARQAFEPAWNRLNLFRTWVSVVVGILLIAVAILR